MVRDLGLAHGQFPSAGPFVVACERHREPVPLRPARRRCPFLAGTGVGAGLGERWAEAAVLQIELVSDPPASATHLE